MHSLNGLALMPIYHANLFSIVSVLKLFSSSSILWLNAFVAVLELLLKYANKHEIDFQLEASKNTPISNAIAVRSPNFHCQTQTFNVHVHLDLVDMVDVALSIHPFETGNQLTRYASLFKYLYKMPFHIEYKAFSAIFFNLRLISFFGL